MKTLKEMSTQELEEYKADLAAAHQVASKRGLDAHEISLMWLAADQELWDRGA